MKSFTKHFLVLFRFMKVLSGALRKVNALSDSNQWKQCDLHNLCSLSNLSSVSLQKISCWQEHTIWWRCWNPPYTGCAWHTMLCLCNDKMKTCRTYLRLSNSNAQTSGYSSPKACRNRWVFFTEVKWKLNRIWKIWVTSELCYCSLRIKKFGLSDHYN